MEHSGLGYLSYYAAERAAGLCCRLIDTSYVWRCRDSLKDVWAYMLALKRSAHLLIHSKRDEAQTGHKKRYAFTAPYSLLRGWNFMLIVWVAFVVLGSTKGQELHSWAAGLHLIPYVCCTLHSPRCGWVTLCPTVAGGGLSSHPEAQPLW